MNWGAGTGIALREYPTENGPADYVLFVNRTPVGVIEAKREEEGHHLTVVEEQSAAYAAGKLKWVTHNQPLPFLYESTGILTRFTDVRDPKPRSRPVFSFHRPETFLNWQKEQDSLRQRVHNLPQLSPGGLRGCQIRAITRLEQSFARRGENFTSARPRPPDAEQLQAAQESLIRKVQHTFSTGEFVNYVDNVRRSHEQIIDTVNLDRLHFAGWDQQAHSKAEETIRDFSAFLAAHKDEIAALRIFYDQPYRRRESDLSHDQRRTGRAQTEQNQHWLRCTSGAPTNRSSRSKGNLPKNELIALVALIRRVCGFDDGVDFL